MILITFVTVCGNNVRICMKIFAIGLEQ